MMIDVDHHLGAVTRGVLSLEVEGKPAKSVTLERVYDVTIEDLWDALTNGERLSSWFTPISGDLKLHGHYQLEGNAGGEILVCDQPKHFRLTWVFGEDTSWVDVLLSSGEAGRTRLKLTHTAHVTEHWATYGPSATGIGWEMSLLGLDHHVMKPTEPKIDEAAFAASPEGKAFATGSGEAWAEAAIKGGEDPDSAMAAAQRTIGFYTGTAEEG